MISATEATMVYDDGLTDEQVEARFEEIKLRFARSLPERIETCRQVLPAMCGSTPSAIEAVQTIYQLVHAMCGMAGTVGFTDVARLVRQATSAIADAHRAKRGMSEAECANVGAIIENLRISATRIVPDPAPGGSGDICMAASMRNTGQRLQEPLAHRSSTPDTGVHQDHAAAAMRILELFRTEGMAKTRILYIDDEECIREIAHFLLAREPDFDVRHCASGLMGLVESVNWHPDIILLDVVMPELDGPHTLQIFKAIQDTADVPVVFLTARFEPEDLDEYRSIGAAGVIKKPFVPTKLASQVRSFV
jgi:CheY-like chemotaxis protein